ncbi:hypothetical protein ACFLS9_00750 [Bacteroidota bacterium]
MKKYFPLIFLMIVISCKDGLSPEEKAENNILYYSSFESEIEFYGWDGIGTSNQNSDVPYIGGNFSVLISGGCVVPHSYYVFGDTIKSGYYTVECWSKLLLHEGNVSLQYRDTYNNSITNVWISVSDTIWTKKTSDPIFLPKGKLLEIEMNSGGFVPGGMLIDELKVIKVEK